MTGEPGAVAAYSGGPRSGRFRGAADAFSTTRLALGAFTPRAWAVSALAAVATLLVLAVPAEMAFDTPFIGRMEEVRRQDYVFWALSSILAGLIAGTFVLARDTRARDRSIAGGALSIVAIGCPSCNKLAVLLLGSSGALNVFGPAQLFIGLASLGLLGWGLSLRARAVMEACRVPSIAVEDRSGDPAYGKIAAAE